MDLFGYWLVMLFLIAVVVVLILWFIFKNKG